MKAVCYICDEQKWPLGIDSGFAQDEILQHVVDFHLPMRCSKCFKRFETAKDLKETNKCCLPVLTEPVAEEQVACDIKSECNDEKLQVAPEAEEDQLSPLSQVNKMWRRKSSDFAKQETHLTTKNVAKNEKQRQTSTPMANAQFTDTSSYSSSSIQISSINFTSSTSSDSDAFSPPIALVTKKDFVSPQRPQRSQPQARSRPRMPVHATPLRQIMSKSIQRAMQEHGHYRESPFALQQRKVSFNSTNSSEDRTLSLMKFPNESENPIDLRTTPARQRCIEEPPRENLIEERDLIEFSSRIEIEQIEVIIRRSEIKSESSATSSFKSCHSNIERSGSMPLLHVTPKIIGNGLLKKTISFETPDSIEKTPALMPAVSKTIQEEEDDEDDVFFTPRTSPYRAPFKRAIAVPSPIEEVSSDVVSSNEESGKENESSKSNSNLWNFVSSVIKIATRTSEGSGSSASGSESAWGFSFKKPVFMQKAGEFFTKRPQESEDQPNKRRRTSSNTGSGSQSSPDLKRQKIQARKPIGRMRNLS